MQAQQNGSISRRDLLFLATAAVMVMSPKAVYAEEEAQIVSSSASFSPLGDLKKTLLDEAIELNEKAQQSRVEQKAARIRKGFEATREGAKQLDDLEKMLFQDKKYADARTFTRLFNNYEQRSIMQKLNTLLPNQNRIKDQAEDMSKELTEILKRLDKAAKKEDEQAAKLELDNCRALILKYLELEELALKSISL